MQCRECYRTESSKWRDDLCNTCYGRKWRKMPGGRKYTRALVQKRREDPAWKAYMAEYEKHRVGRPNSHKQLWSRYSVVKTKSKRLNLPFDLTKETYFPLIAMPCHYCGGQLQPSGVGLDQVVPGRGYTLDNVVPCCRTCNLFKSNLLTKDETEKLLSVLSTLRNGKLWQS